MSSTHMNMMIAFRRVKTPMTPITNSIAERPSDSASTRRLLASENHGAGDRDEQQDTGQLECERVVAIQRPRDSPDRAIRRKLLAQKVTRYDVLAGRDPRSCENADLGDKDQSDEASEKLASDPADIRDVRSLAEIEQHYHEEEDHHYRAGVQEELHRGDELRVQHHVFRGETEHRDDEPHRRCNGTAARHERHCRDDRDYPEQVEMELIEQAEIIHAHSPLGSVESQSVETGCVCAISRSRSYTCPSLLYSEFS